jgi:DNA-binding transcriptional ArsR family regulator
MVLTRVRPTTAGSEASSLDQTLRAVADPTRRGILALLAGGERAAGDIAAQFPRISRPAVSQHLGILAEARLVTVRKEGHWRVYRSRPEGLAEARAFLDNMWRDSLARLKAAAERAESESGDRERVR